MNVKFKICSFFIAILMLSPYLKGQEGVSQNLKANLPTDTANSGEEKQIDEVVVVGYGRQRKKDVTGAISSIKSDQFVSAVPVSPQQLLQGKLSGVSIVQNSGQPGSGFTIRVRGSSSISASNDPLYVIDGVPVLLGELNNVVATTFGGRSIFLTNPINPMALINSADIESIDILKDASSTAIYGARAANGVIAITTRNNGTLRVKEYLSYDVYVGLSQVRKKLPFLTANEAREYASQENIKLLDLGQDNYWQDLVFRKAFSQNHTLSFGDGKGNTNMNASLGYSAQEGVMLNLDLQKYTARFNVSHSAINKKLKLDVNAIYGVLYDNKAATNSSVGDGSGNMLKDALRWNPTFPIYNQDGSYYIVSSDMINPLAWQDLKDQSKNTLFLGNFRTTANIFRGLKLISLLAYASQSTSRYTYVPGTHPYGIAQKGNASVSRLLNDNMLAEFNLNYDINMNDNHSISMLAGYSFQRFVVENAFVQATNFILDVTEWNLMQSGITRSNTSSKNANRLLSFYGRINYKLLGGKYLFTATLRRDGSNRFGENNQWGLFPSAALAWNIADEAFLKNIKVISNFKLRAGYGITGNQNIPSNLYVAQLGIDGTNNYIINDQAVPAVAAVNISNPYLKWESTTQLNIGLDFGFLDNRISGSIDVYNKDTKDLLLQFPTTEPSVIKNQWANVGEINNKGLEFSINAEVVQTKNFKWTSNFNISFNRNKVISLSNDKFSRTQILTSTGSGVVLPTDILTQIIKPGNSLYSFYGRKFLQLDDKGNEVYEDINGDGKIDDKDYVILGNANPTFEYGFNNTFVYKQFTLVINIRGVYGNLIYNNTDAEFSYINPFTQNLNILKSALTSGVSKTQNQQYSSRWLQNGSYLRLDNISLAYNFSLQKIHLKNAKIYISGQNLFVWTSYTGFDPEVKTRDIGIDYLSYPRPMNFQLGLSLNF